MYNFQKLKLIITLSLFIILSSLVLSEEFSGYKYPNEPFKLNGDNFTTKLDKSLSVLSILYNNETILLKKETCRDSASNLYRICFNGTFINLSASPQIGKLSESSGELIPAIFLEIKYKKPEIKLKRTFSNIKPELLEEIYANITIENNGKNPADFIYTEKIPESFEIIKSTGFNIDKNELILKSKINALSTQTFVFSIRPKNYSIIPLQGNLSYSFENINAKLLTEKITITPSESINLNITNQQFLDINQESILSYNISNNYDKENIEINFSIFIPDNIELISFDKEFTKIYQNITNTTIYFQKINLNINNSKKLDIKINPLFTGNYIIKSKIEYKIFEINKILEKNLSIKINTKKIDPIILTNKDSLTSNENFNIQIKIKNNNTNNSFQNIKSIIKSDIFLQNISIEKIMQNEEIIIFNADLTTPIINETKILYFNYSGIYESINHEKFNFSINKKINITPIQNSVYSSYEIDKSINYSDKIILIVYIENKKDDELKITSKDYLSNESLLSIGEKENTQSILPYSRKKIYSYTLNLTNTNNTFEKITNILNYTEGNTQFLIKKDIILKIKQYK